jgi:hypothetical protein
MSHQGRAVNLAKLPRVFSKEQTARQISPAGFFALDHGLQLAGRFTELAGRLQFYPFDEKGGIGACRSEPR